uniref:Transmembrane protein 238 n=1 Tax=Sander lucioperca TaxID=283035 RepID=A0A8C9Y145_SANLU
MELKRCIGGCVTPFLIAFLFDVLGLILVFVGIFANVRIGDRFYGDFLIYSGSLIIFFSLAFWLMWYVGNVQVSEDDEGGLKKSSSIVQLARKLSESQYQQFIYTFKVNLNVFFMWRTYVYLYEHQDLKLGYDHCNRF